jgi:protein-S-isoprenylcysteine O-methyltransferase Ste14
MVLLEKPRRHAIVRFWKRALEFDNILIGVVLCCFAAHGWISVYQRLYQLSLYYSTDVGGLPPMILLVVITYASVDTVTAVLLLSTRPPIAQYRNVWPNLVSLLAAFGAITFVWIPDGDLVRVNTYLCLSLIMLGAAIVMICLAYTRSTFSITPQARFLVRSGPYSLVRHPMYDGNFVSLLGLALLKGSVPAIMLFFIIAGLQIIRARLEEQLLERTFTEYSTYRGDVGAFIPKFWSYSIMCLSRRLYGRIGSALVTRVGRVSHS